MRWLTVGAASALLAGCGGSTAVSGGAAGIVPADAAGFVALDTHLSAGEWAAVGVLLQRFPAQDPLLTRLSRLQSVLGPEVDLVAIGHSLVTLTRVHDRTRLLAQLGGGFSSRQVGDWAAFARNAHALEGIGTAKATLANARSYKLTTASLPVGTVARAYASPAAAQQLLDPLASQEQVLSAPSPRRLLPGQPINRKIATERFAWAAAALIEGSHSLKLAADAQMQPQPPLVLEQAALIEAPKPVYPSRLVDEIPADALAVADFEVMPGEFEPADPTTLPPLLRSAMAVSPNLPNELDTILGGETAVYVRLIGSSRAVTLVTQPADTRAALEDIATAKHAFRALTGVRLHVAVLGGELVISTTQQGIAAFRAAGTKLSRDPIFERTAHAAGLPTRTTGFVYADLRRGAAALRVLAPLFGVPVPTTPEDALLVFGNRVGNEHSSTLFLLEQ